MSPNPQRSAAIAVIAVIAGPQGGHITHRQLISLGLTRHAIAHLIARGYLIRVHRGVYAAGHVPTHPHARAHAALLVCGDRSALSHGSAATLWGIWRDWWFPLEVTVATDRRPAGLRNHHSRSLRLPDIRVLHGLRVTSPALTVLQITPRVRSDRRLNRIVNDLRLAGWLTADDLAAILRRFPHNPGARRLGTVLGLQDEPTRSSWEDEWVSFAERFGLPPYAMNGLVCGYRVDVRFESPALIVELDGWETHQTKVAFLADREQDAVVLARTGTPTVRITYDQFHADPAAQAARVLAILASRKAIRP